MVAYLLLNYRLPNVSSKTLMFTKTRYVKLYVTNYTKYLYTLNHVLNWIKEVIIYDDALQNMTNKVNDIH